ncbi:MAG: flagellar hook-basal body complex protein FliE [Lachnospiraceae bacterium]|nr:flagellar hook-basal body complex protein FliE [Lachnospiraceae bacterium]
MDLSAISGIGSLTAQKINTGELASISGLTAEKYENAEGTVFQTFLNSAIDNINYTNAALSNAENEEIKFALGETENTHDLTIALQKASTALQYTVAVRDKLLEAYKEIMNMQI